MADQVAPSSLPVELRFAPVGVRQTFSLKIDLPCRATSGSDHLCNEKEPRMSKTDAAEIQRRTERQVANTSGGGHLGGTNFGQAPDAKTAGGAGGKSRPSGGRK